MTKQVSIAFDPQGVVLPVTSILPLKQVKSSIISTQKYQQVLSSVLEVGIIEPLIVFPQNSNSNSFVLLDGHIRLSVLKQIGETHARCLIATDDETYTYNKRVNRMATIQEHSMILKATRNGVSEERIARVLKVDVTSIRAKRDLLNGICKEAAELLKNKRVSLGVFSILRKLKPMRQIEVAELLLASANFSVPYAKALLAATQPDMLLEPDKHKVVEGLTPEQIAKMEKEMEVLQRDLKLVEESHGNQVLNLVLARSYLARLFDNGRVARYLGQHHADIFRELQMVCEGSSLEN
ncbi:MAG TPA: plasmid partitioning protein RepB C-terminal domain-containing protein [Candidatus Acidoferrum sp.]|nr:plasmid partitioning protein RepB C-terminal domain-containing protein [Candidatus Acidoferrum sp.]